MNKIIPLSLIAIATLTANEVELAPISVESTYITEVSQNAQVSADLAQALSGSIPSIDMNRRSGIANDIYIRGQKRDNISVEVDGTKVCGACPNRMDPPVSHILANQIEDIEVIEGPYDVETFGTLSGGVKIRTKKPTKDAYAEMNFGVGNWGYSKIGFTTSGGNNKVRVLVSGSSEAGGQYKDGNGDTIAEQIENYAALNPAAAGTKFKPTTQDMSAYSKRSVMAKAFVNVADNHELRLSVTANRSDDILYGNSKMDALYDDSNIYSVEYDIKHINDTYDNINLQYYKSDVDHPMATKYRMSSNNPMMDNTNHLKTTMQGAKAKTTMYIGSHKVLVGLDASQRTWDGDYYNTTSKMAKGKSINDSKTNNIALFTKMEKSYGNFDFIMGARYDSTEIEHATLQSNDYSGFNANILTNYKLDADSKLFLGFGQAKRVPDARELYFTSVQKNLVGTPTLEQTTNQEIDLGYEINSDMYKLKVKAFYSMLSDYIYIKKGVSTNAFENIDATVYGTEISASYYATDEITLDAGISYKKGEKDSALAGQTDTDLADIAPLRTNLALSYEYMTDSTATLELQTSNKWSDVDSDNGEQELDAWSVLNLKVKHSIDQNFIFTLGVNNLLDETYMMNNSYVDLTLITAGGASDVLLMNEPGRYVYSNLTFKF